MTFFYDKSIVIFSCTPYLIFKQKLLIFLGLCHKEEFFYLPFSITCYYVRFFNIFLSIFKTENKVGRVYSTQETKLQIPKVFFMLQSLSMTVTLGISKNFALERQRKIIRTPEEQVQVRKSWKGSKNGLISR